MITSLIAHPLPEKNKQSSDAQAVAAPQGIPPRAKRTTEQFESIGSDENRDILVLISVMFFGLVLPAMLTMAYLILNP